MARLRVPNIQPGLIRALGDEYGCAVSSEDLLAYVYGVLAQPGFTARYRVELGSREVHVPFTKDGELFSRVGDVGERLLWLHTYGERFAGDGRGQGQVPQGRARCMVAVPGDAAGYPEHYDYDAATQTLKVGAGEFAPVSKAVWEFEVSGLKVVQSWLGYRMKRKAGRSSSPLDEIRPEHWTSDFTTELLELLWVLEATLAEYPAMERLLGAVVEGPCFRADELPTVPDYCRRAPAAVRQAELFGPGGVGRPLYSH